MAQLLQALDEQVELPPQEDLNELFEQLRVASLARFSPGRPDREPRRAKLLNGADRLAAANTAELVRLVAASERDVALEAVRRAAPRRPPPSRR